MRATGRNPARLSWEDKISGIGGNRNRRHQIYRDYRQHGEAADIGEDANRHGAAFVGKAAQRRMNAGGTRKGLVEQDRVHI